MLPSCVSRDVNIALLEFKKCHSMQLVIIKIHKSIERFTTAFLAPGNSVGLLIAAFIAQYVHLVV